VIPSTPLPLVLKNAGLTIEEALPAVISRQLRQAEMVAYCGLYRRTGIARLLLAGRPQPFFEDLSRSARAFLYFLEGVPDDRKATSLSAPFLDAIACDDTGAAEAIARRSRTTWNPDEEYEEDFLFLRFLMARFALGESPSPVEALLGRWAVVEGGSDGPRLSLCTALQARDQAAFDEALTALVEERSQEVQSAREDGLLSPDDAPTTAKIWVDLLALLRCAGAVGLETEEIVPMAPPVARRVDLLRLPAPDSWRHPPSHREFT
jgi:hypothetical protein